MDNYGDPVFNKDKDLIGYQIGEIGFASVFTYKNIDNLICNKVLIRDFDKINLLFKDEVIDSWTDIKTESGFVREYKRSKYFYDNNNNLIHSEIKFSFPKFPILKKENHPNNRIGSIDLETYGSSFGLGYHQVYAGGWSTKNNNRYFYLNKNETSEQLVNRLFSSIFTHNDLNGYTFYVHNLGRFDSVFIIKSLILNDQISIK